MKKKVPRAPKEKLAFSPKMAAWAKEFLIFLPNKAFVVYFPPELGRKVYAAIRNAKV